MLQRALLLAFGLSLAGVPAWAESFSRISDRDAFIGTVSGKELRLGLFGIALTVEPDGDITGRKRRCQCDGNCQKQPAAIWCEHYRDFFIAEFL